MSYFEDLTPHTYWPMEGKTVLNVGWLDARHPFPRGESSAEFVEALGRLCERPCCRMRGWHFCEFCPRDDLRDWPKLHPERCSDGSVCVRSADGVWYAAPKMVHHFVVAHQYLPPAAFVAAVLNPAEVLQDAR